MAALAEALTREFGQMRSREFEFRVIDMNKVGEGESSNSVMAVL